METISLNQTLRPIYNLLRVTFSVIPIVAGLDKFTNILTDWTQYLHPGLAATLPINASVFMMIVGVIEIIAGIIVFIRPAIGGFVVAAWLTLISLTLLAGGHYLDVAVRDLVMAVGALTLARIAKVSYQKNY